MLIPVLCASLTFSRFLTASYGLVAAATFPHLVALVVACAVSAQNENEFWIYSTEDAPRPASSGHYNPFPSFLV